jgi:hypothetical protein
MRLIPHQQALRIAVGVFLPWYFLEMPMQIINAYGAYARAFWEIFSFPFLLRTLLAPWKNVLEVYPKSKFDFNGMFQALCLNLISRAIGCVVRLVMIVLGIVVHACCLVLFTAWLTLWVTYPAVLLLGSAYLLQSIFT